MTVYTKVWVTRTMPAAMTTGEKLRALGYLPVVAPVLQVRLHDAPLNLEGVGAIAFTSRNGVATFARRRRERHLRVFAVGDGTAEAACQSGFHAVESAGGDVDDLPGSLSCGAIALAGLSYA